MTVYRVRNWRLGVKIKSDAIGWAAVPMAIRRDRIDRGDPTDLIEHRLKEMWLAMPGMRRNNGEIETYIYLDDDAYRGSVAEREGMPREAHRVMVERRAAELSRQGWRVCIVEMSSWTEEMKK